MINICTNFIHSVLLPASCLACGKPTHQARSLCTACTGQLPKNHQPCPRCALPGISSHGQACAACQRHPPAVVSSHAPLLYREPVSGWIQRFKFHGDLVAGRLLADLFIDSLAFDSLAFNSLADESPIRPDRLLAVPLHPKRLRQRGFNQAEWLARRISKATGIPMANWQVKRIRQTADQHELPLHKRLHNLSGSFSSEPCPAQTSIAIIDDVITSGATAEALATTLLQQGAGRIMAWALARTPKR